MRRSLLALPVLAAGVGAALLAGTAPASAATVVTGGTAVLSETPAALAATAEYGIVTSTAAPAQLTWNDTQRTVDTTLPVTGGTASLVNVIGAVETGGSVVVRDVATQRSVTLTDFVVNVRQTEITVQPSGSDSSVVLFDLGVPITAVVNADGSQTLSSGAVTVDAAGAAYLDSALDTSFFTAGQTYGSFTTTFEVGPAA